MSDSRKGNTPSRIGEKNPNSKIVYCYDLKFNLIKEYKYTKLVENDGLNYHTVRKRCSSNSLKPYKNFVFSNKIIK